MFHCDDCPGVNMHQPSCWHHPLKMAQRALEADNLKFLLRSGVQPNSVEEYVFKAFGAAGRHAPIDPKIGSYREDLARAIGEWCTEGINSLKEKQNG